MTSSRIHTSKLRPRLFKGEVLQRSTDSAGKRLSNAKKAAFLREALRVSGGAGQVYDRDIGDSVDSLPAHVDCVTARALAPLNELLVFAEPVLARGAIALFMKGRDVEAELNEATKSWIFKPVLHGSLTGDGCIVDIATLSRRDALSMPADI